MSDFYQLLGVQRDASEADIKKAYRKVAMQYHPDRNSAPDAEERFKACTEAYEVLRDPETRAAYDRWGRAGVGRGAGGFTYEHVDLAEALSIFMRDFGAMGGLESLFGGAARPRGDKRKGQDIRVTAKVTLAEVATGVKRTIKLKTLQPCGTCEGSGARPGTTAKSCGTCAGTGEVRRAARNIFGQFVSVSPCPTCGGEGSVVIEPCEICRGDGRVRADRSVTVDIPPGVSNSNYLTLRGQGAAGPRGGPAGDLVVMIEVKDDDRFERQGDDLVTDLNLTLSQAVLGGRFTIPTATAEEEVQVPAGVQPETVLRLRGRGLPRLGHGSRGDVLVRVHVYVPESVSPEQEEIFRRLAQVESQPPRRSSGFWSKLKEALGA
ncbi:MAG: molecular chaperone DnaJ [Gemmatimonadales bacterium]